MRTLRVEASRPYDIFGGLRPAGPGGGRTEPAGQPERLSMIVTDSHVGPLCGRVRCSYAKK